MATHVNSIAIEHPVMGTEDSGLKDRGLWGTVILTFPAPQVDDSEVMFRLEEAAFVSMLPALRAKYDGRFVAVHNGVVVDSDVSRVELIRRFFNEFGDTHVYIGFVGPQEPVSYQISPFKL